MSTLAPFTDVQPPTDERPSVTVRLQTATRRAALTRQLANGENPTATGPLRLRARQLTSARNRAALADALRRVIREAQHPSWSHGFSIVSRRSVLNAIEEIDLLVKRLHSPEPVTPHGMARVSRLLTDGATSPLYGSADAAALRRVVLLDTAALNPPEAVAAMSI